MNTHYKNMQNILGLLSIKDYLTYLFSISNISIFFRYFSLLIIRKKDQCINETQYRYHRCYRVPKQRTIHEVYNREQYILHQMAYMKTLPLLEGAKVIIINEGLDAMHARTLIAGWLNMWKEKNSNYNIDLLSFSDPKLWYYELEPFKSKNVHLHDYYSIDINENAKKDLENLEYILKTIKLKPQNTVIVSCLSSLVLYVGLAKTLQFIEKLSRQVSQLICIYRRDFIQNKIPAIETLGTTYIKLEEYIGINSINNLVYTAKLIHRKLGGSIICQTEMIKQGMSYQINTEKIIAPNTLKSNQVNTIQPVKIESSFRIEMNAQEMEQRNKTPLPYILNTTKTSQIFYHLDDADDLDEEDPDDDLCF